MFGIQAGLRGTPTSGPSAQPGQSISGATDAHNKEQGTAARLTDPFGAALSTEAAGPADLYTLEPSVSNDSYPGYTGFTMNGSITTSQGVGAIQLTAFWPLEAARRRRGRTMSSPALPVAAGR